MATPMTEVEQAVGRILRKVHEIRPVIIDLIDKCGNFVKQSYTRNKLYTSEHYQVQKYTIDLDNYPLRDSKNREFRDYITSGESLNIEDFTLNKSDKDDNEDKYDNEDDEEQFSTIEIPMCMIDEDD